MGYPIREVSAEEISAAVAKLAVAACYHLGEDVLVALRKALDAEPSPLARQIIEIILQNAEVARQGEFPLCQDTGIAVVFVEWGQDAHLVGGNLQDAIAEGVRRGYREGYLRSSVVAQPFSARINTGDNTPPVIHVDLVPGDRVRLAVLPKGAGSENMSFLRMLPPAAGRQGLTDFVVECVEQAGANPCPPVIVGVGVGGTADYAMLLAKKALLRRVGAPHPDPEVAALESELLARINDLGIGPQGLGGRTTALAVHVETFPCHIASLPVAVNLQCHSARHQEIVL